MTLSAARNTPQIDGSAVPTVYERGVAGGEICYQGGMACLNSSGYLEPAGASAGQSAVLGRFERTVDNSAGSDGDVNARVLAGQFKWGNSGSSISLSDEGSVCYAADDESVHLANTGGRPIAGIITRYDSDGIVVQHLYHVAALAATGAVAAGQALPRVYYARSASTANVANLAAFTVSNDGVTCVAGDYVLLKDQSSADENGLYVVGTVGGGTAALTRAPEFDDSTEVVSGAFVHVSEGTANADHWFTLTSNATLTVGTSNLAFTQMPQLAELASTANGDGASLIGIEDAAAAFDATDVEGAFAELVAVTAGNGANIIGYEDAGSFTAAADVDAALDELYQHSISATRTKEIPIGSFYLATGAPLAIFADGASAVPGSELNNSKAFGIRWNDNGTHDSILGSFTIPDDADVSEDMTLVIHASKSGATVGDATTFVVEAYNQVVGALADADANYGGTTSAMTGDATAKTVQEVTLTLANANLPAKGQSVSLLIEPTSAVLGTDDVTIHSVEVKYTSLLRTS